MYKSYFEARRALDEALAWHLLPVDGQRIGILRFLVEHTMFKDHGGQTAGYVDDNVLGEDVIADLTGISRSMVRRALAELEAKGLIRRHRRPVFAGGRQPDLIEVRWLTEGACEAPSVGACEAPSVGACEAPSSSFVEESLEERADHA